MEKQYIADYHVHTSHSPDANAPMNTLCETAYQQGIAEIAFTDHYEFYYQQPKRILYSEEYIKQYFDQFHQCQSLYSDQVVLLAAAELGQMHLQPEAAKALVEMYSFDYLIGSMHKLHDVDLSNQVYTQDTIAEITKQYWNQLYQLARQGDYDCIGHLNLVRRYSARKKVIEPEERYEREIKEILKVVIDRGKGIEVNTSGLRQGLGETLPSYQILCWYFELGGEILTIGSDAHRAIDLAGGYQDAVKLIQEIGFRRLAYYRKRRVMFRDL